MRKESGISLLEVMIALVIVMLVLYAAMTFFIGSVRQYKVQTKLIESNVEGVLGLELLRRDVESLGFGLHWNDGVTYTERTSGPSEAVALTDSPSAPRPVVSVNGASSTVNNSDYLVVRSARLGRSDAAGKWTTLRTGPVTRPWNSAEEDLVGTDRVIVIAPGGVNQDRRTLVTPASGTNFSSLASYTPADPSLVNLVYGIDDGTLARPFNRAEYFIDNVSVTVPPRCAPNTGVLVKAIVRHDTGTTPASDLLPLLDCVADMQVVYGLDTNSDRAVDLWTDDISNAGTFPAEVIRTRLVEVQLYILAQQGQRDDSFRYPSASVLVGPDNVVGRSIDVSGTRNYRWKVYSIVVKPRNLAN